MENKNQNDVNATESIGVSEMQKIVDFIEKNYTNKEMKDINIFDLREALKINILYEQKYGMEESN